MVVEKQQILYGSDVAAPTILKWFCPSFGEGIDEVYDVKVSENGFEARRRNENNGDI